MNKNQRDNLAKFAYDISKLVFAAFVLANIMSEKASLPLIIIGVGATITFLILGYILNKG